MSKLKLTIKRQKEKPEPEFENEIEFDFEQQCDGAVRVVGTGNVEGGVGTHTLITFFDDGTNQKQWHGLIGLDQINSKKRGA